jgi:hypothetical protein
LRGLVTASRTLFLFPGDIAHTDSSENSVQNGQSKTRGFGGAGETVDKDIESSTSLAGLLCVAMWP